MWYHKIFGEPEDPEKVAEDLNKKYSDYLGKVCFTGSDFVVYKKFKVDNGEVNLYYLNSQTPEGLINYMRFVRMEYWYEKDFIRKQRNAFVDLHHKLKLMGYRITQAVDVG